MPNDIHIATLADLDGLVRLEELCFKTDRLSAKQFRYFIKKSTALVLVMKYADDVIAGVVLLFRKGSKIARLYSIAVDPAFQKQGIAQTLYTDIERQALRHHCGQIRLEVKKNNYRAIRFYRKNGYEVFGEYKKFYEDGYDALRMQKVLPLHEMKLK